MNIATKSAKEDKEDNRRANSNDNNAQVECEKELLVVFIGQGLLRLTGLNL